MDRIKDKTIRAGRKPDELAVYLDQDIIDVMDLKRDQRITLMADKSKQEIIIKIK